MRYTIGCRVVGSDREVQDGYYVFGNWGLPFVARSIEELRPRIDKKTGKVKETIYMPVFDNLDGAKAYISELSSSYWKEFHSSAKKYGVPVSEFRFFLRKVDSSKLKGITLHSPITERLSRGAQRPGLLWYAVK